MIKLFGFKPKVKLVNLKYMRGFIKYTKYSDNITNISEFCVSDIFFYFDGKMSSYMSAGIFIFASITDYVDGLSRYWKVQTNFGRMLDPSR